MDEMNQKNYYEILEVPTNASPDEIQQGYTRAKNAYSQDSLALYSLMSPEECQNILDMIDEAYSIISDPEKRKAYDQARGLNKDLSDRERRGQAPNHTNEAQEERTVVDLTPEKKNMSKIVAQKKFQLEYTPDAKLDDDIEQCTDFTGDFLKKVREYKNVDIVRMAEMTKVSKTYITNIELEAYDKLPAPVYVRGFVYQYAKCLKLNPELVASSYLKRMRQQKDEL
jgi:hypothetical protein